MYFRFNLWEKNEENIALVENKKFKKVCFKPSEHILYSIPTMVGGIISHSLSNFCPNFLINQVGMSVLVKKKDYKIKIIETESKINSITGVATTTALSAVKNKILSVGNIVKKTDIVRFINDADLDKRVATLAITAELKDKITTLQAFDSSYFCGKVIRKMMALKSIYFFSQNKNIFKKAGNTGKRIRLILLSIARSFV